MRKIFFALIIISTALIYFYKIDSIPSGVYVDEATILFNAKSIAETGADEYGKDYPMLFRLFGSYTPPLFIYIAAVLTKIFGNGIAVLRAVSAVSSVVSIYILYRFITALKFFKNETVKLITVYLFGILPWVVFNSRLGYETTLAFTIFFLGIYYCYLALTDSSKLLIGLSVLSVSTYVSYPARYLFLIFVPIYLLFFVKCLIKKNNTRELFRAGLAAFIIQIPNLLLSTTEAFWVKNNAFFENGIIAGLRNIVGQILNYYSPKAIFFESPDIDLQHTIPGLSLMYSWMVIPFIIGLFTAVNKRSEVNYKYTLFLFLVLIIPASLSGHFISTQRAYQMVIPLIILVGIGLNKIYNEFSKFIFLLLMFLIIPFSLLRLYRSYFVLFPVERANAWNYGYEELANKIKASNDKFLIDNSRNPRNYMELLYHLDYPPQKYQSEVNPFYKNNYYKAPVQDFVYKFGRIEVRSVNWETDPCISQIIVGDRLTISENQANEHKLVKEFEIKDKLNNPIFIGYKTRPEVKCE